MLTEEGKETVRLYRVLQGAHQRDIGRLEGRLGDVGRLYSLLRRVAMRISARKLPCGTVLTAIVTEESAKSPKLATGDHVCALVKASGVILGLDA